MVEGEFLQGLPTVPITLTWKDQHVVLQATLDTGFSGDVHVSKDIAKELSLTITGYSMATLASGKSSKIPYAMGIAAMENAGQAIQVHVSNGIPLIGIGFLSKFGYIATIDCKYKKVHLKKHMQ